MANRGKQKKQISHKDKTKKEYSKDGQKIKEAGIKTHPQSPQHAARVKHITYQKRDKQNNHKKLWQGEETCQKTSSHSDHKG